MNTMLRNPNTYNCSPEYYVGSIEYFILLYVPHSPPGTPSCYIYVFIFRNYIICIEILDSKINHYVLSIFRIYIVCIENFMFYTSILY